MDNWLVLVLTAAISLAVTVLSKLYDRHIEYKFGSKKHLTEQEVALAIKKAENAGTLEGYAWKRMQELDEKCDVMRKEISDLSSQLSIAKSDYEEATARISQLESEKRQLEDKLEKMRI